MIDENINEKFHSMGVLLLLDCPQGLQFGIDNISWRTGDKFKGVKLIPLGTHIIAYTLQSENHMFKISKFLIFNHQDRILVYRWHEGVSQFVEMRGEEAQGYRNGVKQYYFDSHLGPYPQQNLAFWSQTTKFITKAVLSKLDPLQKMTQFGDQYSKKQQNIQSQIEGLAIDEEEEGQEDDQILQQEEEKEAKDRAKQNPGKFMALSDTIHYSDIPRVLTSSPAMVTQINMDKTPILKRIIDKEWKGKHQNVMGQLQYSFVHFIIGENEESYSQWKKIVDLLVTSQTAFFVIQQTGNAGLQQLEMNFIAVFYDQLSQFPPDFFRDTLSKDNFICRLLKRLKEYSRGQEYSKKIGKRINKLLEMIQKKFDYYVDSQQDEDEMPTVVLDQQHYF